MDIADKIKFLRTNILDLSQDKFAKKIDVTRFNSSSSQIGAYHPVAYTMNRIIKYFFLIKQLFLSVIMRFNFMFIICLQLLGKNKVALFNLLNI